MKKSMLTLAAIALTAIAITSCGGSKPADETTATATVPAQDPQQELDAALAAATTPEEKAEVYAKAIAEAKATAESKKTAFNAANDKFQKAPSLAKKALQGEVDKAKAEVNAADAWADSVTRQAAEAAATPVIEAVVDAFTE